jgi:dolichyl-diphosphooligosaccharide--protein glycosyltransferase
MQVTSVAIFHALEAVGRPMSLNDVCAYVPAWFGVSASLFTGLLAYECSGSLSAFAATVLVMACMPAHLMRSIGGGYDNESIAVTAMTLTFALWCRSLRDGASALWGALAGVAYIYMVAAWGGYVFVLNLIGAHVAVLILTGRLSQKLYRAYSLFFVIGTAGALQFPVVGLMPFKSMEQLGPLFVFIGLQVLWTAESRVRSRKLSGTEAWGLRIRYVAGAAACGVAVIAALMPTGYFGPLSMRVRSLFIKHTRTGNPLVDSVAEHQPTSADAYWHHLHYACYGAPLGFVLTLVASGRGDSKSFLILYALIAYYFANKMNRLIILMGPIASALTGVAAGLTADWIVRTLIDALFSGDDAAKAPSAPPPASPGTPAKGASPATPTKGAAASPAAATAGKASKGKKGAPAPKSTLAPLQGVGETIFSPVRTFLATKTAKTVQAALAVGILALAPRPAREFWNFSHMFAEQMSQPSVVFKARLQSGETILVTDYLDSYEWLKAHTPEDARVLSWWDYGYQITGIGNRTTLADGNTWNLEHIALIGRMLTSTEKKSHEIVKHMADYVLVWSGGGGDDLAKSPHMARIGTSVFTDICGRHDPSCYQYGFINEQRTPTPMMANSLLYKMTMNKMRAGVQVNSSYYNEVFTSKYGKVRIYEVVNVNQRSKRWLADPANRICDPPGSWQCPGQYPPAVQKILHNSGDRARRMIRGGYKPEALKESLKKYDE